MNRLTDNNAAVETKLCAGPGCCASRGVIAAAASGALVVVIASSNGNVDVWDPETGKRLRTILEDKSVVVLCMGSLDEDVFLCFGAEVRRINVQTGAEVCVYDAPDEMCSPYDVSVTPKHMAVTYGFGVVVVWQTATGEIARVVNIGRERYLRGPILTPASDALVLTPGRDRIRFYSTEDWTVQREVGDTDAPEQYGYDVDAEGRVLARTAAANVLGVFFADGNRRSREFPNRVTHAVFLPRSRKKALVLTRGPEWFVWDFSATDVLVRLQGPDSSPFISSVAVAPDESFVLLLNFLDHATLLRFQPVEYDAFVAFLSGALCDRIGGAGRFIRKDGDNGISRKVLGFLVPGFFTT